MTAKTLFRTIKDSFGRFFAIIMIFGLGIGFFTGLKSAEPSMRQTAQNYLSSLEHYDFQIASSLGLTGEDVEAFQTESCISKAEGGYRLEAIVSADEGEKACIILSVPLKIALLDLISGRMPETDNECVVDSEAFSDEAIGSYLEVADNNGALIESVYKIVGRVRSPRYISSERGSASIGSGTVEGFVYIPSGSFTSEVYHEILLKIYTEEKYFSENYDNEIRKVTTLVADLLKERADSRYNEIYNKASSKLKQARDELDQGWTQYESAILSGIPEDMLEDTKKELEDGEQEYEDGLAELEDIPQPETYVLDNSSNTGYARFQNDIRIIDGIANAFPVFFAMIAVLVCITTMTRMVTEERTQIGTLKALGYGTAVITMKYVLYAALAGLTGCVLGFFFGTGVLPRIIWDVYAMSYGFTDLEFWFSPVMYAVCLAISVLGSAYITWLACRRELKEKPADLIRPKAPGKGQRIFIEGITFIWSRLSFLNKVMLRNAFRYKQRMIMMLVGIAGCTALVVTGFGIKDSVANILDYQYDEIMKYDAEVRFSDKTDVEKLLESEDADYISGIKDEVTLSYNNAGKTAFLIALAQEGAENYFDLHKEKEEIAFPAEGEAVVTSKLAGQLGIDIDDVIMFGTDDYSGTLKVAAICDNFIGNYVYTSLGSVQNIDRNTIFYKAENADSIAAGLRKDQGVNYVSVIQDERDIMADTMSAMNYIVLVVLVCAAALAFVVIYNLTNINIMERIREIATVKVLGFHSNETASYILRENIFLAVIGSGIGIALGRLLHKYVLLQVQVDTLTFEVRIAPLSYAISFIAVIIFAELTNLIMRTKLHRVNMAESLKAVE